MEELWSISPIDGRYKNKTEELRNYFSEAALIKYRILVECEYFISLCETIPQLYEITQELYPTLRQNFLNLSEQDFIRIKEIEKTTNHDVKAVEYFMKEKFDEIGLSKYKEFLHFGLTSQDINNTSIPLMIKKCHYELLNKQLSELIDNIDDLSREWINIPMLSRTHGQPATPTRIGKELAVFVERLERQLQLLNEVPHSCKFGGATGNFNAHKVAYPKIDWNTFADNFTSSLGLNRSFPTTQIEHYDNLSAYFDGIRRINVILIDFCRDIWQYISMNYIGQKVIDNEVGSSAMPHKVNPIDFENAEGNLGIANSLFDHFSNKLPISRLQRDLTDSTVLRNVGVPISHTLLAIKSINKGLSKLSINEEVLEKDLEDNWIVVSEGIQTILRRENYPDPYEELKRFTRGKNKINQQSISEFISSLDVSEELKNELRQITPHNYLGI
jgi:adenylosuccinate lyase